MTKLRSLAFVLAIAVAARAIGAQADPDSAHRIGCRLAAQTLLTGNPDSKMNWAIRAIPGCGDHGVIGMGIAATLSRLRHSSDTAQLLSVRNATFGLVDGDIFVAALAISADSSASPVARAVSLLIVLTQLRRDAHVSYTDMLASTTSDMEMCPGGITFDVPHLSGPVPLPADAKTHALALAQSLESNASLPTLVRAAARCVVQEVQSP